MPKDKRWYKHGFRKFQTVLYKDYKDCWVKWVNGTNATIYVPALKDSITVKATELRKAEKCPS